MTVHSTTKIFTGLSALALTLSPAAFADTDNTHKLELKSRVVYFDREFDNESRDREQSALSYILNYKSPQFGNFIGVNVAGYYSVNLDHSGNKTEDVLTRESNGELDGFSQIGEAYVNITPVEGASIKLGRQRHKTLLLLTSTSRTAPNTYQGGSFTFNASENLTFHGAVYDEWSRRARDTFEGFSTDQSEEGAIDYVSVLGAKYKTKKLSVELEYLNVDEFLSKLGVRASYTIPLDSSKLKITGGIFTSSDNGDLFVTGSENGELDDEDVQGSIIGETKSENNGLGGFVDFSWKKGPGELSFAYTIIDEIWLEDNFAGYHGTNPFPTTSRIGPDLTNSGENAVRIKYKLDWNKWVPGLVTAISTAYGWDAENSEDSSLGSADENWTEFEVRYKVPQIKNLDFRGIWHHYESDEFGVVDGVKGDQRDIRIYLNYTYTF